MRFVGAGRGKDIRPHKILNSTSTNNRIDYHRKGGPIEWYVNDPHGIEQGFSLQKPLEGEGKLKFKIAVEGDTLTYHGLYVTDAQNNTLNAELAVLDNHILIQIDDQKAVYPIVVDP